MVLTGFAKRDTGVPVKAGESCAVAGMQAELPVALSGLSSPGGVIFVSEVRKRDGLLWWYRTTGAWLRQCLDWAVLAAEWQRLGFWRPAARE